MKLFEPFHVKNLNLKNRIVMPPMCIYSADSNGLVNDRHLVHYASRAVGGTGLIIVEATGVMPEGRITDRCLGIWEDAQIAGLRQLVDSCHQSGALVALQLNHAGRKCTARIDDRNDLISASPIAYDSDSPTPREMTREEMSQVRSAFCEGARRAHEAGFDAIEVHGAHGFLVSSFLSPLTNHRTDEYGGSLENRSRFLLELLTDLRRAWPAEKALSLRLSAIDYLPGGIGIEETIRLVKMVDSLIDLVHISSGGIAPVPVKVFPGYQVPLAQAVKESCELPVIAVGAIRRSEMIEEILRNGRADLVALGSELLRNPYWVALEARKARIPYPWPAMYEGAFKREF